jgi:hypothetical protein
LKIRRVEGYANFDKSVFAEADDSVAFSKKDWEKRKEELFDISTYLNEDNFKSYDAIKTKLARILGQVSQPSDEAPPPARSAPEPAKPTPAASPKSSDSDDDDMAYFRKLASENDEDIPF